MDKSKPISLFALSCLFLMPFTAIRGGIGLHRDDQAETPVNETEIPLMPAEDGSVRETAAQVRDAETVPVTERVYLSGTGADNTVEWEFYCTAGRKSGYWTKIAVPSCWEQQGFGAYNYGVNYYSKVTDPDIPTEKGRYRYRFNVPSDWKGRRVRLVFEASMTDTKVSINGKSAGAVHQGGFYRFSYGIDSLLVYGADNLLEAEVSKESANKSVNMAERRADYWNFGGIFRPVFLEVSPRISIDRLAVDARADGSIRADVFIRGEIPDDCRLMTRLVDSRGVEVSPVSGMTLPPGPPVSSGLKPGSGPGTGHGTGTGITSGSGSRMFSITGKFQGIETWTAETPDLYTLSITLYSGDKALHRVSERIGFRTIEIRKTDGFYLNGQRVLLKGVNRHSFRPESGRTLSPAMNYEDARLLKAMNMNTVRMSHYPPDPEFLDACDELGIYVLDELGGWQRHYDTDPGEKLVREMVTRDVNHPGILFWDNGNEGGWNIELDDDFAVWDPQKRSVLHPQQEINGVETMHYRSYGEVQEYLRREDIYFPTEFLHGLYDGGHGAGLYDYWEMMRVHPGCGGGILWDFADAGLVRTDLGDSIDTDGNHGADGILGPHHEPEGSYYSIREIWAPVHIPMEKIGESFDGRIRLENRYDFLNLNCCSFHWELGRFPGPEERIHGHTVLHEGMAASPDIPPHSEGELILDLSGDWRDADVLYLSARDPEGREIWKWSWKIGTGPTVSSTGKNIYKIKVSDLPDQSIEIACGDLSYLFDPGSGMLRSVRLNRKTIRFGNGPRFVAARRADRTLDGSIDPQAPEGVDRIYREIDYDSRLLDLDIIPGKDSVVLKASYFGPLQKLRWTVYSTGELRLDYEYRYDGVVELMGISFDYPEENVKSIRWLGEGPYRVWQNRLQGTWLDIWENDYNDAVPAQVFTYPEFKGYFGPWYWSSFRTAEGRIIIENRDPSKYLGVYTPRDGKDALLYTLPETGIAVLDVIPAVRNKVNATDLTGPSSQARHISGSIKGSLVFRFTDRTE